MKMAKVLAINSSPRHNGNTAKMLGTVLEICKNAGLDTEIYQAGGLVVRGCLACSSCFRNHPGRCITDDWINDLYNKMKQADAILLGSPTYFADLTPELKAIIDRCGYLARSEENPLSRKVGAAVSAVRRAGGIHTLDSIGHFFLISDMIMVGSSYWNMSIARGMGDYEKDDEGVATMTGLGENIVWLLNKIL